MNLIQLGVAQWNLPYWVALLSSLLIAFVLVLAAWQKGDRFSHKLVLVLLSFNFALHFLKQFIPAYQSLWPGGLVSSSAENFCALMVLISPILYLSQSKFARDYLFYMGVLSGLVAILFPTRPVEFGFDTVDGIIETLRYYVCHIIILAIGPIMLAGKLHTLSRKRFWLQPLFILFALAICFANCALMNVLFHNFEWDALLERGNDFMNSSFCNGPGVAYDEVLGSAYPYLIPYVQIYYVEGILHFTPILWLFPFLILLSPLVFFLLCFPFTFKRKAREGKDGPKEVA